MSRRAAPIPRLNQVRFWALAAITFVLNAILESYVVILFLGLFRVGEFGLGLGIGAAVVGAAWVYVVNMLPELEHRYHRA